VLGVAKMEIDTYYVSRLDGNLKITQCYLLVSHLGSLLSILVHRNMTCDIVAHHASEICGMVVTAILFVVPSSLPWLYRMFQ